MKNIVIFIYLFLFMFSVAVYADDVPPKYALVIGNGAYSGALSRLANQINDANDIAAVLQYLGFTVDII